MSGSSRVGPYGFVWFGFSGVGDGKDAGFVQEVQGRSFSGASGRLQAIARKTSAGVAQVRRAKILLMADEVHPDGGYSDKQIAEEVGLCERQVVRIRQTFVKSGVPPALTRATRLRRQGGCPSGYHRLQHAS